MICDWCKKKTCNILNQSGATCSYVAITRLAYKSSFERCAGSEKNISVRCKRKPSAMHGVGELPTNEKGAKDFGKVKLITCIYFYFSSAPTKNLPLLCSDWPLHANTLICALDTQSKNALL